MQKYEFKEIDLGTYHPKAIQFDRSGLLKQAGEEGWKMVTALPVGDGNGTIVAFMQREVNAEEKIFGYPFEQEYTNDDFEDKLIQIHGKEILGELKSARFGAVRFQKMTDAYLDTLGIDFRINGELMPRDKNAPSMNGKHDIVYFMIDRVITPKTLISFVLNGRSKNTQMRIFPSYK